MNWKWNIWMLVVIAGVVLSVGAAGATGPDEEGWRVELTPYAWFTNIDGTVTVGENKADFEASFSDLVDKIDVSAAFMTVVSYGPWVGFGQMDYFALSQDFSEAPGGSLESDMLLLSVAGGYRFHGLVKGSSMELLGGVRYLWSDNTVEVNGMGSDQDTSELIDAIVMLRPSLVLPFISERLRLNPTMSIGTGDSDLVWEVQPELQYQITRSFAARAGYRRLHYEFADGDADVDVGFQGFIVGVGVTR